MNKRRRTRVSEAHALLGKALSIVEGVTDEEQEGFDNLPENLHGSERGELMEEVLEELQAAIDSVNDAIDHIDHVLRL